MVNSRNGGMILSESNVAAELYGDAIAQVGFTNVSSITHAMSESISQSEDKRKHSADELRKVVSLAAGENSDRAIRQLLEEIATVIRLR